MVNMLSLSQGHCQPLGGNDEHVSAIQFDDEVAQENVEDVASHESHIYFAEHIQNDTIGLNVIEGCQELGSINEQLKLSRQVP